MSRFIRMPWDEAPVRWTPAEMEMATRLAREGRNSAEIADALAEAGFEPRDETNVNEKLRRMART